MNSYDFELGFNPRRPGSIAAHKLSLAIRDWYITTNKIEPCFELLEEATKSVMRTVEEWGA